MTSLGLLNSEVRLMGFRVPATTGKTVPDGAALEVLASAEVVVASVKGVLAEELVVETTTKTKVSV